MSYPFLKSETFGLRTQETFVGNKCEIYVPDFFFNKDDDNALATDLGDRIETMGLLFFFVDGQKYNMNMPIRFQFQFSSVEKKKYTSGNGIKEIMYFVYTLKRGDAFVYDVLHRQSADDFMFFFRKIIENAKLPPYISYEDSLETFLSCMVAAKCENIGLNTVGIEFMLSEIYRDKKNLSRPFRFAYSDANKFGYRMVRFVKLPQLNSTFSGVGGEDINTQLVSAVTRTRENGTNVDSPIEKIIKY